MGLPHRLRHAAIGVAATLLAVGCNLPRPAPSAATFIVRTPEATQTPSAGAASSAGFAIDFTQVSSSGMATMTGHAHTCTGLAGPWEGTVDIAFAVQDLAFTGSGSWSFVLDDGRAEGEVVISGSGEASQCMLTQVSDPLRFELDLNEGGTMARIHMGSMGAGTITVVCPEAPSVTIPFATAWGNEEFEVSLQPYSACSGSP